MDVTKPAEPQEERSELAKILTRYAREPWFAAEQPTTPKKSLIKFSKDESSTIRTSVIKNPNSPVLLVKRMMMKDADPNVRREAAERLLVLARSETQLPLTGGDLFGIASALTANNLEALVILKELRGEFNVKK